MSLETKSNRFHFLNKLKLDHPNIVRLEEVYESQAQIYLVQELCLGGELFDRLDEQPDFHYTENDCAILIKQMLCAVRYLHSHGIIHRDLKLENFLFSSKSKDSELKMIDFGLSKHFINGEVQHDPVGTPYTVAPEVLRGCYGEKCDIWAIGVITYLLLSGEPPFGGCGSADSMILVRDKILSCNYQFEPVEIWARCSVDAKNFIRDLLKKDPRDRPTAREAQLHQWLREWTSRRKIENDDVLDPKILNALVSFTKLSDIRRLLCEVLSFTLLPNQVRRLRREFEKMDIDGSGEISLAEFKQALGAKNGTLAEGTQSEEEIEGIFNAMRVRKSPNGIHWHEFIAASLSECRVDERNLRLAFDRLDSNHKGVSLLSSQNVFDSLHEFRYS
jgi:calcium-dependent protein kinase